ncbi:PBSX family phage terminase large subunit [Buttiauxella brennerae]|uniref:PBSX family phage terminase large subunit n=1 Tax=Buttiauxella brennerae TaxID=82988 RepID=UPI00286EC73C|nr:PBSX family phage terminase large subunit [Buttiauxella brennerae]
MSGLPPKFKLKPMRAMMRPLFEPHRVKCLYGGRGSGKSWDVAEALIEIAVRSEVRVLCLRRVQKSIAASSHQLLSDTIRRLGYESEFTITNNAIRSKQGAEFMFMGLQSNLDSVKSIEGVDICWVEEAHSISRDAWEILLPTIRRISSEVWVTFNPDYAWDDTYIRFVLNAEDDWFVQLVNWSDNEHFTPELEKERQTCLKYYPDRYDNIWEGVPISEAAGAVVNRGNLERLFVDPDSPLANACRTGKKVAVLDVADEGADDSVLTVWDGYFCERVNRLQARDPAQLAVQALKIAQEEECESLIYDSVGVGAGVRGELNKYPDAGMTFKKFVANGEVQRKRKRYRGGRVNEEVFLNLKAQAWWAFRDRVNDTCRYLDTGIKPLDGMIAFSSKIERRYKERILSDSTGVQWESNRDDKIQIEDKKSVKKRIGVSTDYADAVIPHTLKFKSGLDAYEE